MFRKIISYFLVLALILTLVPMMPQGTNAASTYFVFDSVPSTVNAERISLVGTLNQVASTGISYSVKQLSPSGIVLNERAKTSIGITVSQDGTTINVLNVQLFPGKNRVTFFGKQGSSDVDNYVEIEYIDTPLLYNLQITANSKKLPLNETSETIATKDLSTGDGLFTIEGNAPNVKEVIVDFGSGTRSAAVREDANNYFILSQVKLRKGMNTLKFLLRNGTQSIEVERKIVYFDGTGTFYNVNMTYNNGSSQTEDLSKLPQFTISNGGIQPVAPSFDVEGYMIIPVDPTFTPSATLRDIVKITHQDIVGSKKASFTLQAGLPEKSTTAYHIYKFNYNGNQLLPVAPTLSTDEVFTYDNEFATRFEAFNPVETGKNAGVDRFDSITSVSDFGYKNIDALKPFVSSLAYNDTVTYPTTFTSTTIAKPMVTGTMISRMPFAIRMGVKNGVAPTSVQVRSTSPAGGTADATVEIADNYADATSTRFVWLWIRDLPFNGTQTLELIYNDALNTASQKVTITSTTGPYARFDTILNEMIYRYDPLDAVTIRATKLIDTTLSNFKGTLENVVVVPADYTNGNITMKINNSDIKLTPLVLTSPNRFTLDPAMDLDSDVATSATVEAYNLFRDGQNTITFRYSKGLIKYETTFKVTIYSNNLPEIPKQGTVGVFPFNTVDAKPDNRFVGSNGIYTTKETEMKVFGTFDFLDLGITDGDITSKLSSLGATNNYVMVIEGPNGFRKDWNVTQNTFTTTTGGTVYNSGNAVSGLSVTYVNDNDSKQYFQFVLDPQTIPTDGSKVVYTFTVYNSGVSGSSKSSYRLEVSAPGVTYKLVRPILPLQNTVNQNYVEVVIYAENSDSININKVEATKADYDADYDGDIDTDDYRNAFRAVITDLKPGKANTITFTIRRGTDTITDSFDIFYAPATLQGAQFMTDMKNSNKVFENKVSLSFAKDTYLVRWDYDVAEDLKGQVFKGHDLLFAIANHEDGVVDRFDYLPQKPVNFSNLIKELGQRFKASFDNHYVKASQVYWINAGLADNPSTQEYDSYDKGFLPILPNSNLMNPRLYNFDSVPRNRVLIPNKRGTLELAYDPNVVPSAANNLTVFHYNPSKLYWENLGGTVNTGKKTISVPFDKFGYYVVAKLNDSYLDVIRHPYARNHIEAMMTKGVIIPRNAVDFVPDVDTTRGEFTAMIVRALQLPLIDNPPTYSFDDVATVYNENDPFDYRHIETASRAGIVRGKEPRIFEPYGKITRQEAAVILARALQLKTGTVATKIDKDLSKLFKDFNLIDPYARPFVVEIAKKKYIIGSPVDPSDLKKGYIFEPSASMLRGDASILVARVMASLKKIPTVAEIK